MSLVSNQTILLKVLNLFVELLAGAKRVAFNMAALAVEIL